MAYSTNGSGFYSLQSSYLNVLEERGVVSPETALPLDEIDSLINPFVRFGAFGSGWLVVHKLSRYGVLRACPGERYYLDQAAAENFRHSFARWLTW
ncbi:MAG: hypothetical protein NTZ77_02350 [Caldiserica bacterium]|jgi:hypothetical protein|nr:hypothetical protein [Caldisericota bacterium]